MAAIPRQIKAALAFAKVRRDSGINPNGFRANDFHQVLAFHRCVARADKYVRDWGKLDEVATAVAEDDPKNRRLLKLALSVGKPEVPLVEGSILLTQLEKDLGVIMQTDSGAISRIVDSINFVSKDESKIIQIADACAYSFSRYLSKREYGPYLVQRMLGFTPNWDDWQGPVSDCTFSFDPRRFYPK